jgi:hypothetical protein
MTLMRDGAAFRRAVILLTIAAFSRLLLQILSMPPYAGLDELYHAARVEFGREEGRQPAMSEPSMPLQFVWAGGGAPNVPPSFSTLGAKWPEVMQRERGPWPDPQLARLGYHGANYEAQQPSLWYWLAARLPAGTMLGQLLALRLFSVVCALVIVFVAMRLGTPAWAALLVCVPSWLVLIPRASNDGLACAALALALVLPRGQAAWWPIGIAAKGYVAPLLAIIPLRASKRMIALIAAVVAVTMLFVMSDLRERAGSAIGLQQFGGSTATTAPVAIDYSACVTAFIASFAWPGAEHGNALRPVPIVVFLAPLLAMLALAFAKTDRRTKLTVALAVAAFLAAQSIHFAGFVMKAMREGRALPEGGYEGWYIYALAPLAFGLLLPKLPRRALLFAAFWLLAWDVVIHEGGLFRDYAGLTAPFLDSSLFRWSGAMFRPAAYGAGGLFPAMSWWWLAALRFLHVGATVWLVTQTLPSRPLTGPTSTDA